MDNIDLIANPAYVPSILPEWCQDSWSKANTIQSRINTIFGTLDNVQNFVSKLAEVPSILSDMAGTIRVFVVVSLPFRLMNMANLLVVVFQGRKDEKGNLIQPRAVDICDLVGDIGNLLDDFGTFVGAIDKVTQLSATVNAVAQWIGFAGILLQLGDAAVQGYFVNKGVKALSELNGSSWRAANTVEKISHLEQVTNLSKEKIEAAKDEGWIKGHLKKRIHFDISMRTIAIIVAIAAVVALCLSTFGVGVVVTAGAGLFAALAVSQLLLIPIKAIVNHAFDKEYEIQLGRA